MERPIDVLNNAKGKRVLIKLKRGLRRERDKERRPLKELGVRYDPDTRQYSINVLLHESKTYHPVAFSKDPKQLLALVSGAYADSGVPIQVLDPESRVPERVEQDLLNLAIELEEETKYLTD